MKSEMVKGDEKNHHTVFVPGWSQFGIYIGVDARDGLGGSTAHGLRTGER